MTKKSIRKRPRKHAQQRPTTICHENKLSPSFPVCLCRRLHLSLSLSLSLHLYLLGDGNLVIFDQQCENRDQLTGETWECSCAGSCVTLFVPVCPYVYLIVFVFVLTFFFVFIATAVFANFTSSTLLHITSVDGPEHRHLNATHRLRCSAATTSRNCSRNQPTTHAPAKPPQTLHLSALPIVDADLRHINLSFTSTL